ncbi:hypothetical protein TRFO_11671 [Tritrichomonas foetus]|uniref:Uncharacterized protein n=1 Tax=Tritrichomonas foetus TaxID=1144522 RepID=A0A1J4J2J1_9EUKA|nr:hypothetical protein TRFO_11671 [Tritrichomonas foetus]|eukprot:OHS93664.1 hypothetical protein TRFO_11671 [Tritrichomonas foetus]
MEVLSVLNKFNNDIKIEEESELSISYSSDGSKDIFIGEEEECEETRINTSLHESKQDKSSDSINLSKDDSPEKLNSNNKNGSENESKNVENKEEDDIIKSEVKSAKTVNSPIDSLVIEFSDEKQNILNQNEQGSTMKNTSDPLDHINLIKTPDKIHNYDNDSYENHENPEPETIIDGENEKDSQKKTKGRKVRKIVKKCKSPRRSPKQSISKKPLNSPTSPTESPTKNKESPTKQKDSHNRHKDSSKPHNDHSKQTESQTKKSSNSSPTTTKRSSSPKSSSPQTQPPKSLNKNSPTSTYSSSKRRESPKLSPENIDQKIQLTPSPSKRSSLKTPEIDAISKTLHYNKNSKPSSSKHKESPTKKIIFDYDSDSASFSDSDKMTPKEKVRSFTKTANQRKTNHRETNRDKSPKHKQSKEYAKTAKIIKDPRIFETINNNHIDEGEDIVFPEMKEIQLHHSRTWRKIDEEYSISNIVNDIRSNKY